MGFLSPLFLLAALAVGIPLFLHLFQRHESRRIAFPALRYLQRTKKEHAKRIRFRQLILLLLRIATLLALVAAGARMFLSGRGGSHEPTALAIVLDNSMSSGVVQDGVRALERLKGVALTSASLATADDRVWVIRAGEPWDVAVPGTAAAAISRVRETSVSHAPGDLSAALARARTLVGETDLPSREIHLVSDLQESAFTDTLLASSNTEIPLVVFRSDRDPVVNRSIAGLLVGGGLPPLANQRGELSVSLAGPEGLLDTIPVRLVVDERVRGAVTAPANASVSLPIGPYSSGTVRGYVEIDPDALRADDREYFVFPVRSPPRLALLGPSSFFVERAVEVLVEEARATAGDASNADVLLATAGEGLETRAAETAVLVIPPDDPTVLPALNRRLAVAGIPWTYQQRSERGEARIDQDRTGLELTPVRVVDFYRLTSSSELAAESQVEVSLMGGDPWIVAGVAPTGAYVLLASPMEESATDLPVSAQMLPLLEWAVERWGASGGGASPITAGTAIRGPATATHIVGPDGVRHSVDGDQPFLHTGRAGVYTVFQGDSVVREIPINTPAGESDLAQPSDSDLSGILGPNTTMVGDSTRWHRAIFGSGQGPELWRPLVFLALLMLLAESLLAAAGPGERKAAGRMDASPGGATSH